MNLKELESMNDYFRDDTKFIGEYHLQDYKVMRGYVGGYGDELRLYYTKFDPPIKKASICIVHGFGEHQGRFLHVADMFAKLNFVVHLIDLRGFGYSGGPRGSQTVPELHMDLEVLLKQASKDLPLFLYGHAMGGLLIISLLIRNQNLRIAGIITTSPMLGFPLDRKLKGFKYYAVKFFGHYLEDLVINTKVNPTGLTKNDQHIQRCFEDKLMMPFLGIRMAQNIIATLKYVHLKSGNFKYPILLFHGKQDSVADYKESHKFYENCGSKDKTIKLFEDGYHELQHDEEFIEMKTIITEWCAQRIPKAEQLGIQSQARLNYGIPIQDTLTIRYLALFILLSAYIFIVIKQKKQFKGYQYPFIPALMIYRFYFNKQ